MRFFFFLFFLRTWVASRGPDGVLPIIMLLITTVLLQGTLSAVRSASWCDDVPPTCVIGSRNDFMFPDKVIKKIIKKRKE